MGVQGVARVRGVLIAGLLLAGCNLPLRTAPPLDELPPDGLATSASPEATASPQPGPSFDPGPSPGPSAEPTSTPTPVSHYRMYTLAGTGLRGDAEEGALAVSTTLFSPSGLVLRADGSLYIADYKINRVRRIDPGGYIHLAAGNSLFPSEGGDEGPAVSAGLAKPYGVVMAPNGDVVFSEYGYSVPGTDIPGKVRRIDSNGVIHLLAGGGNQEVADGVGALQAKLGGPEGLAYDRQGNLYIAEYAAHRVSKLDTQGKLTIVAGTGQDGNDGDGGPATQARLGAPNWVTFGPTGELFVVDSLYHVVRAIDASGSIRTVAGTGQPTNDPAIDGYVASQETRLLGDGGPARSATLHTPTAAAFDAAGNLLVADSENQLIRSISPSGVISSIAGTGAAPQGGLATIPDGTDSRLVPIMLPDGLFVDPQGNVYFSEYGGYRVRKMKP